MNDLVSPYDSGAPNPWRPSGNPPFQNPLPPQRYTQFRSREEFMMAQPRNLVTWGTFWSVISGLVGLMVVVVGGSLLWLRSDVADLRTDIRDIRGGVTAISMSLAETRLAVVKAIGEVEKQAAITNTKLDGLTDELKKHR